jgi:WD40 repeat protein
MHNPIRCLAIDERESLLLTSTKSAVKIFSLNSHPIKQLSSYIGHSSAPFCASFMRSGMQVATCDGSVNLWDIETRKTLAVLESSIEKGSYTYMQSIPPRLGITPGLGAFGDNQLLTCLGSSICHYDFRLQAKATLKCVSDWVMPPLPIAYSHFSSNTVDQVQLSCAAVSDFYIFAGSTSGGMWAVDRRMGRVLNSWQAHEGPVVKVRPPTNIHLFSYFAEVCIFLLPLLLYS